MARAARRAAARAIWYALTLRTVGAFGQLADILRHRLDPKERAALAYAALRSLDAQDAEAVAGAALEWGAR